MAESDRREVRSRLTQLIAHLLKWQFQAGRRSRSWQKSIDSQRAELHELLSRKTLKNHASENLERIYRDALKKAAVETDREVADFPPSCSFSLKEILGNNDPNE